MRHIISIYLWIVGFVYFIFFLLFALLVSYLFPVEKYNPLLQKMLRFFFVILNSPVEVEGIQNLNPEKTYLYMANHVSLFDIPLFAGFIPGIVRGVEAKRQHRWPLYGWVMSRLGNIPIERDNIHSSIGSIRKSIKVMSGGRSMLILPEGHRTLDGDLRQFKKLPFYMAKQINFEVVPIGTSGLFHLKRKGSWLIHPTKIKINFGDPIPVEKIETLSILELRNYVRMRIEELVSC